MPFKTIEWTGRGVRILDQRLLPGRERYLTCRTAEDVARAIERMAIRGAPAIGVAAALGLAWGARSIRTRDRALFSRRFAALCRRMASTRPTARNLFWAIERMKRTASQDHGGSVEAVTEALRREALAILEEDIEANRSMGRHGQALIGRGATVLTYCNAGALATAGYGTALGVIRAATERGKRVRVIACETRPLLQGARLTAWELTRDGIPTTLITDNMAGSVLRAGGVGLVIVGADRIASNGDTANKIGTYGVAVLASENGVPFYVAAPFSTVDLSLAAGEDIPIEERHPGEVTRLGGVPLAPEGITVRNPAFDVTPHRYITAIITERGIARAPFSRSLRALASS